MEKSERKEMKKVKRVEKGKKLNKQLGKDKIGTGEKRKGSQKRVEKERK